MTTADIKNRLHNEIEHGDERLLKIIYALVQEYNTSDPGELRKKLILQDRANYLNDEGKSYSWEEVKKMAINKQRPDEI